MIQEQATKIISKNLYQVLTGHFFKEFTSKLQLEINKQPISGGNLTDISEMRGRAGAKMQERLAKVKADEEHQEKMQQMRLLKESAANLPIKNPQQQQQQQQSSSPPPVLREGSIQQRQMTKQESMGIGQRTSPPPGNERGVSIRNKQIMNDDSFTRAADGSMKKKDTLIIPKTNRDPNAGGGTNYEGTYRTQPGDEHDYSKNKTKRTLPDDQGLHTGKENLILKAFQKMIDKRLKEQERQHSHRKHDYFTKRSEANKVKETNMIHNPYKAQELSQIIQDRLQKQEELGYLRIGDIICLIYDERVYDQLNLMAALKNEIKGVELDIDHILDRANANDNLKARITQDPDLVYRGILFSDGVTDKLFQVMPRQLTHQMSAFSQFKKTLFRIEIAQDCKYNTIKQDLIDEMLALEHARSLLNEERALHSGHGSIRRGNKELDEIDRLDREMERVEKAIKENDKVLTDELKNNEFELQMNIGKKITYGQRIQFKHIFSELYLTLNTKKISHEHGCVQLQLTPPNQNSWFILAPSEKIKTMGMAVSYLDNFLIQNYIKSLLEKPRFFVHVNNRELLKVGKEAVLEVNASNDKSQFKAKLFADYKHLEVHKNHLESGDVIRLLHKEANGYMTVFEKDVELGLPQLPDFLQRQVSKYSGNMAERKGVNKVVDADELEEKRMLQAQRYETRKRNQTKVFIERDIQRLQYTNSCWEIQKVRTFEGGNILMNDVCRIKHIGTGKYLAVNIMDKRELTLKEDSDETETMFRIHRDTYRPPKKNGMQKGLDTVNGDAVQAFEMIILETFQNSFIHLSERVTEDYKMEHEEDEGKGSGAQGSRSKGAKVQEENEEKKISKNLQEQSGPAKKETEKSLHDDPMRIEPLLGYFSKEDPQKMIFVIEAVDVNSQESKLAYMASSYFKSLYKFFCFLNVWSVVEVDEEELEILHFNGVQTDMIDKFKYDFQAARETDGDLKEMTEDIEFNVVYDLIRSISRTKETSSDQYYQLQRHLAEQGILVLMIKLLELIYYKVTPQAQRDRDLLGIDPGNGLDNLDENPEMIAMDYLDPLADKILRLLHLLIKQNRMNAERVTKYENIIYMMLTRYDPRQVAKIFKETYKRAQVVFGENEDDQDHSVNSIEAQSSVMKKWVDRMETIYFVDLVQENISNQILYLDVISMMCRDSEGQGLFHYQVQAINNVLDNPLKVPITFDLQQKSITRPIIFINKRIEQSDEMFIEKNPQLRTLYQVNRSLGGNAITSSVCLDLFELTAKNISSNGRLQPYIDWIAAVITMYCHMCLTRNSIAINTLKSMGLTFEHVLAAISQTAGKKKKNKEKFEPLDKKLIAAYIMVARVMYVDNTLFPSLYTYNNRCYFWETVQKKDAYKTMYRWEKDKFFRGFEENNRFLAEEQDKHENLAMGTLREHVYTFFSAMPEVLQSFLYSFESNRYSKKAVTAVLTLLFNYVDCATSLIESELVDSKFIYRMLNAAAIIIISYHYKDMPNTEEEKSWIYMVLYVAKKTKRCKEKVEILEFKTLKLLEVICKFRLNSQILIFLQLFRRFVEDNLLSHVSHTTSNFDERFQVIFQLYQFNVGKNLTYKTLKKITRGGVHHANDSNIKRIMMSSNQPAQSSQDINNTTQMQQSRTMFGTNTNQTMTQGENFDDANESLLQIGDILLRQKEHVEEEQQLEIDDQGNPIERDDGQKGRRRGIHDELVEEDDEEGGDGNMEDKSEQARKAKQYNDKYELDKFLLYLVFAKKTNRGMRGQAVKVLINNFNQRDLLLKELPKIELIISPQDQEDYKEYMKRHYMLKGMIDKLHQLSIQIKAAGGNGRARDVVTYTNLVENLIFLLRGLTKDLAQHQENIIINDGNDSLIKQEQDRLNKKQNMLRHMNVYKDLIEELMQKVVFANFFKKEYHVDLFKEVCRFLFIYCYGNLSNQRTLNHYLKFLVVLTDLEVPSPKLISIILTTQRQTEIGINFLRYLTERILSQKGDTYKSFLFNLLTLMMTRPLENNSSTQSIKMINIESNQIFVLKRLVKKNRFRKQLLLNEATNKTKLDIIVLLNQRIKEEKGFAQMTKADRVQYHAIEWEAYKLHVAVIELICSCVRGCNFGRLQSRKLITVEVLFDSILSEAVPYLLRRRYLRLLYEVYIRILPDDTNDVIDFNTEKMYQMMFYVVYEDLRQYARYYQGLLSPQSPEDFRDNDTEQNRKKAIEGISQKSVEDVRKRNTERTRQEMDNFKDVRQSLSTLKHHQNIVLIDETDKSEYWRYLSQYKKSSSEADGLLHFITDFYKSMREAQRRMSKEMIEVASKIREILMEMSDNLHSIKEMHGEHIVAIEHLVIVIDQALAVIPDIKGFKASVNYAIKAGINGGNNEDVALLGNALEENKDEDEEDDPVKLEAKRKAKAEQDESHDLDIKMASDKIINVLRDSIAFEKLTIRQFFKIKSFEQNYIMRKLDLKKVLKALLGSEATNDEIEMFMSFLENYSAEETEQRRTIQPDIATEGYIRIRIDPLKVLRSVGGKQSQLINFRDLENVLKKALQKIQYKPPVQKRDREKIEEGLNVEIEEDDENWYEKMMEKSRACNVDLKIFTKCFFDFFQRFRTNDEIADLARKICFMFNEAYENDQDGVVKKFIQNMVQGFNTKKDKFYLLKIFNRIVENYLPSNPINKRIYLKAKERLGKLQITMKECGLLKLLIKMVHRDDVPLSTEAIKMLSNLLQDSNIEVQNVLLDLIKMNREAFQFFDYIQERMHIASDFLIGEMDRKLKLRQMATEAGNYYQDPRIDSLYNRYQQPFYLPSQANNGQGIFNLETELLRLTNQEKLDELLNILKFLQLLCDNCHHGFQNYLRNQEENANDTVIPLTTINIVSEVANIMIKLTEKLGNLIFTEFIISSTVSQLFDTLIDFVLGPNIGNQTLLGGWKKFSKAVNFYLEQNLGVYLANTTEQKAKLLIMKQCTDLILALSESVDLNFRRDIILEMVPEINVKNLKNKMVEIFHFKIGVDPQKQRTYYSNKKCKHYRDNTLLRKKNMCEKGEFCEFNNLIEADQNIIAAGFNLFIFLYTFKIVEPTYEYLANFDSEFKKEAIYKFKTKEYAELVDSLVHVTAERNAEAAVMNELEIEEAVQAKTEQFLQEINIKKPAIKIYPELAKRQQEENDDEDKAHELEQKVFEGKSAEEKKSKKNALKQIKKKKTSRFQNNESKRCFGLCNRRKSTKVTDEQADEGGDPNTTTMNDNERKSKSKYKKLNDTYDQQYIPGGGAENAEKQAQEKEESVQSLLDIFYEKADKYSIEQYMMDCAMRFFISNVAEVEIDYNGVLTKVMFRIPPYCTFLSNSSQKKMIFEANHESHIEKLEEFFNRKRAFQAEMKSIQKLERKSVVFRWGSQKWKAMANISLALVLLINLMFVIFYQVDKDGVTIKFEYQEAQGAVTVLAIMQVITSFLSMISYIVRFHGKIFEEYLETFKTHQRDRFSNVKGSLGYSFGSESFKFAYAQASDKAIKDDKDDELKLHQQSSFLQMKDLKYSIRVFFVAIQKDAYHAFNVLYFLLSILGIFYHTVFSFLLLDIVIKIPILSSVVQAIVQNRKQLFYTMILLSVVIYIYSYIAFMVMQDSYISSDTDKESKSDNNNYCRTLLECFTSTLNNGLRASGGIGDVLEQLAMDKDPSKYWIRYVFDLSYFCIVMILLLNLIFGIIIDAFADMRDFQNQLEIDVKERCFICGLNRIEFETKNKSWIDHIQREHNAFAYLYFILYVQDKPGYNCNGVEKYVKALILKEDPIFFPVGKCLSIGSSSVSHSEKHKM